MNAKDLRIVYNVILLFAILFILRFSIYIFNPEAIAIKQALTLATLGLGCDLAPLVLFFVLGKFCNTCMRILTNIYLSILTLYYIINFIFISQSSQILSSDLIISTYPNIIQYFFLSPLRNIFFITIVLAFVCLTVSLYKIIYASKYKAVTYCFIILLPCLLFFNFYYQSFKHIKLYQNFFRGEWIARPMYENIRILINAVRLSNQS